MACGRGPRAAGGGTVRPRGWARRRARCGLWWRWWRV